MHSLYSLKDPVSNEIKWIGISTDIKNRYQVHLSLNKNIHRNDLKFEWIKLLSESKLKPLLTVHAITDEKETILELEHDLIKHFSAQLYNKSFGTIPNEQTREKMRINKIGKKQTKESIQKMLTNRAKNPNWTKSQKVRSRSKVIDSNGVVFDSLNTCAEHYKIPLHHLQWCLYKNVISCRVGVSFRYFGKKRNNK